MGIEGSRGTLTLVGSDLSQFPDGDGFVGDDDNDALRLGGWPDNEWASLVEDCRLSHGEDDAIDHETAFVRVSRFAG